MLGLLQILNCLSLALRVLFPDEVGCATPEDCERICNSRAGCTNLAFVKGPPMNDVHDGYRVPI